MMHPCQLAKVALSGGSILPSNGDGGAIRAVARVVVRRSVIAGNTSNESAGAIDTSAPLVIANSVVARNRALGGQGGAFNVQDEAPLRIVASVIRGNDADVTGGAIRHASGALTILGSRFIGNEAGSQGGAIRKAGTATVLIDRSIFSGNSSGAFGGALELNEGTAEIRRTTIERNRAQEEGGGVESEGTPLLISSSTISGNRAELDGGGIAVEGSALTMLNSTVAGNRSLDFGGGIFSSGTSAVSLNAVTVARNVANADQMGAAVVAGGGLYRSDAESFTVRNTLIALNGQGPQPFRQDCAGDPFDSLGSNLLTEADNCDGFDAAGDIVRANPKIGALRDNGGPTRTVALKQGSPAIGKAHRPSAPDRDQRGRQRDRSPDIGAFER